MKPAPHLILISLFLIAGCKPTQTVAPETTNGNINASAPYLWATTAFPRNLKISSSFSDAEVANIQGMGQAWETALENKTNFFNNSERTAEVSGPNLNLDALGDDGINGIYRIQSWPLSLSSSALAVTQIFGRRFNTGSSNEYVRIEHADILINENLYDFRTDDVGIGGSYDLQTVVLHEMGHFLGLTHRYGNTVMIPSVSTTANNRAPTSVDISDVADKYNITLSGGASSALMVAKKVYQPRAGDQGTAIKLVIELRTNGECIHRENGVVVDSHTVDMKLSHR